MLLLIGAAAMSCWIWWVSAPRYFMPGNSFIGEHLAHRSWLFGHIGASTLALFAGPFLLWSGFRRRPLAGHRWTGRVYLICGAIGVAGGLVLSVIAGHRQPAFYLGTFVLGVVWIGAAAMAYRSIRNRQVQQHQEWMVRSYILTISFAACRVPSGSLVATLGPGGDVTVLWATWTIPLFIAEVVMRWRQGSPATR